ncbi:hypothetical protein OAU50_06500 [Planctomycetota bacterium]|nr:hypothetical protein [Planctomycetota bacterium]
MKQVSISLAIAGITMLMLAGCSSHSNTVPDKPMRPEAAPHEDTWLKVVGTESGWSVKSKDYDNYELRELLIEWSKAVNSKHSISGRDENDISQNHVVFEMPAEEPSGQFFVFLELLVEARIYRTVLYLELADGSLFRQECKLPLDEGRGGGFDGPVASGVRISSTKVAAKLEVNFNQAGWEIAEKCSFNAPTITSIEKYQTTVKSMTDGLDTHLGSIKERVEVVVFGIHREANREFPNWSYFFAAMNAINETKAAKAHDQWGPLLSLAWFGLDGQGMVDGPRKNYLYGMPPEADFPPDQEGVEYPTDEGGNEDPDEPRPPVEPPVVR